MTELNTRVAIAVLAAGRSTRMGNINKLLCRFDGVPLVRQSVQTAIACSGDPVIVVTGHMALEIREALSGLPVEIVHNAGYALGLSSSISAALGAVPDQCVGILVTLADMPLVSTGDLSAMIEAFARCAGSAVVRATAFDKPGNPVIVPRSLFAEIVVLEGDKGARQVIAASGLPIIDVEIGRAAALDVDTVEALEMAGGKV